MQRAESIDAVVSHSGDPAMVPCSARSADASDLWLRMVAQDAHSGNHAQPQVAGITRSFAPSPLGPMRLREFCVQSVDSCLRFVCIVATFVAVIAVTARFKFVRQGGVYSTHVCRICGSANPYGEHHQTQNPFVPFSRNLKESSLRSGTDP